MADLMQQALRVASIVEPVARDGEVFDVYRGDYDVRIRVSLADRYFIVSVGLFQLENDDDEGVLAGLVESINHGREMWLGGHA